MMRVGNLAPCPPLKQLFSNRCILACVIVSGASIFGAPLAFGQDLYSPTRIHDDKSFVLKFSLGGGAKIAPAYEGSSSYQVSAFGDFGLDYLRIGDGFEIGGKKDNQGFSFGPSIGVIGKRQSSDHTALTGLPDVDLAVELGGSIAYQYQNVRAFANLRYGIVGHRDFVAELGVDVILQPTNQLTITVGPRASAAGNKYMTNYFGVSAAAATASGLAPFNTSAGFKSVGVAASARYDFNDEWSLKGAAGWNRLVGSAANSPITAGGSADQFSARLGLTKAFEIAY
jgi:outer membrane protein